MTDAQHDPQYVPQPRDPFDASTVREIVLLGFPEVELLDLAGPYEVLSSAVRLIDEDVRPRVRMAAPHVGVFNSRNGLAMQVAVSMDDVERVDLLVVPGGRGVRALLDDDAYLAQLGALLKRSQAVLSVCTGSLLLAKLGLLDGRHATTHHLSLERLKELAPTAQVHTDRRWVEDGRYIISAGVSSGIDAAFHVAERLWGPEVAGTIAKNIEYPWAPGETGEGL